MSIVRKSVFLAFAALLIILLFVYPPNSSGASAIYLPLAFFCLALFLSSGREGPRAGLEKLGLAPDRKRLPALLGWGLAGLICAGALTLLISAILFALGMLDTAQVQDKIISLPLPALVSAFTLAPLGEEAFFRGFLFRVLGWPSALRRGKAGKASSKKPGSPLSPAAGHSWILKAAASSLLFALMHFSYGSVAEVVVAFCMGMLFCALTRKAGSLLPSVFAHAGYNLLSVFLAVACASFRCPF